MLELQVINNIQELVQKRAQFTSQSIGLVPTMGYLHEGHLSLVRKARADNDIVIVSIFVNPAQFGPKEDLDNYPSDIPNDLKKLKKLGVDVVFIPTANEMYPPGFSTFVNPKGHVATEAEGAKRPGHFEGMATIVLKLFQLVQPTNAYFGQKDVQQAIIVANLIKDLHLAVNLNVMPTIREKDGLAMSSRNKYLTLKTRKSATILYKALQKGKEVFEENLNKESTIVYLSMVQSFSMEHDVKPDYIEIRHPITFAVLSKLTAPALLLVAAKVGKARLIDNFYLQENNEWNTGVIL